MLERARDAFSVPRDVCYLNAAYLSPQLRSVSAAGGLAMALKETPWQVTPDHFFADSEALRTEAAALFGGDAEGLALVPSVSYGVGIAAANLPVAAGQRILVLAEQFPSNVYPWRAVAQAAGATVEHVPRTGDWTAAVRERLADDVAVLAVPVCHWTDGSRLDLEALREPRESCGTALVVDCTQSLGAEPYSVAETGADFAVSAGYKWLLGPYSLGYLWVAPRWRDGLPLEHNWLNREASEDFAGLVQYRDGFQPGARRYEVGERSNFVLVPMALAALRQLRAWGVEAVQDHTGRLTQEIAERARALGWSALDRPQRVAHLVGIRAPGGLPEGIGAALAQRQVYVSVRGDSIRIAPHLYNDLTDVDRLFSALRECVSP